MEPVAYQQVVATPFSLRDSPCRTTIWDAGALEDVSEQPSLPLPANFRASCQRLLVFGPPASMATAACPERSDGMTCTVTVGNSGQQLAGSNPSAAMVAAALVQGSNQYVNGVKGFGLISPAMQHKLQQEFAKTSASSSVSTATEAGHEAVAGLAAGSSPSAAEGQEADYPAAAQHSARATKQPQVDDHPPVPGVATPAPDPIAMAQAALAAAHAAAAAHQPPSPSVLVQTAALPPLQLRQQAAPQQGKQDTLQQRVVQTGATTASPRDSPAGFSAAATGSRSPLPPIATGQTSPQRGPPAGPVTPAARPTPTPPPRVRTPLAAKAPIGLFKPSPSRVAVAPHPAAKAADRAGGAASPGGTSQQAPDAALYAAQQLHGEGVSPNPFAIAPGGGPNSGLKPRQPGSSGAFSRFNAAARVPPALRERSQQPASSLSPFITARSAVPSGPLAASAAASASFFGYPLPGMPRLHVPSWSGSNISGSSMLGAGALDVSTCQTGSFDASSFDLRSLSKGSLSAGSVGSPASWAPLQRLSAGSTDALRDYFGQFATAANPWDPSNYSPAALAAFAQTARLSSSARGGASLRAVAAAAVDAANPNAGSLAADSGVADAAAAGPLAKKQRRTAPAVRQAAEGYTEAVRDNAEEALEQQQPPQGRLTPEALSQGAAAAEAALSSQGLLNPSAATVKAPRVAAKGWTAFTAFGLHTRDAVRAANPGATSVEVEKLVGQLWGRLSKDEKQGWVQRAARARSARGSNSAASGQPRQKRKRLAAVVSEGTAPAEGASANAPAVHRRKRSSRVRRPPVRTLGSGELAPQGGPMASTAGVKPGASPKHVARPSGSGAVGGHPGGSALPQVSASQAAAELELELEVGTLEVMASMQAAAANSHRIAVA